MAEIIYRQARDADIPAMAEVRSANWGTADFWQPCIRGYLACELHPRHAKGPRVAFVAVSREQVVGLIAGHLTRRFGCEGELEWISVKPDYRKLGVATQLLHHLAGWFQTHNALSVCVDVEPDNKAARSFYARHGAVELKPHWMQWIDISRLPDANPPSA